MTGENIYEVRGWVRDASTGAGLFAFVVTAFEREHGEDGHPLGRSYTRLNGEFVLHYTDPVFVQSVDPATLEDGPEVVLVVAGRFGQVVKVTEPLSGAARFGEVAIDVRFRAEQLRPPGPPLIDPFSALQAPYESEIAFLHRAGIKDREALMTADLSTVAQEVGLSAERLEAFRLHAEMAHVDRFGPELALALVTEAGIKTREQLAGADPPQVVRAVLAAQAAGTVDEAFKCTPHDAFEVISYAQGYELMPSPSFTDLEQLTSDTEDVIEAVTADNPHVECPTLEDLISDPARREAKERARALMEAAGVSDLSALGTFEVKGRRVIEPGTYVAWPRSGTATRMASEDLHLAMLRKPGAFRSVEVLPDCVRYVHNPVRDALIVGSLIDFIEDGKLIIGKEVTSLTIITEEILYSQLNEIGYEDREMPPPPRAAMDPARAPTGSPDCDPFIYTPGEDCNNCGLSGGDGPDGRHGGPGVDGNVMGPAPELTIYVKRTPEGLPNLNLEGRRGGNGQPGQHAGHGGDGARGRPAKGSFLCLAGCDRGAGTGGNGGDGGRGGDGGVGGAGGSGGNVTICTLEDNMAALLPARGRFVYNSGGSGGNGGAPGVPGAGGRGGMEGNSDACWCDPEPSRRGEDGSPGPEPDYGYDPNNPPDRPPSGSIFGRNGPEGKGGGFIPQPLTLSDWNAALTRPRIVRLDPWEGPAGAVVHVQAANLARGTGVLMDGEQIAAFNVDVEGGTLDFKVPARKPGGLHAVQLRTPGVTSYVYSNLVSFRVTPRLTGITPDNGLPGTLVQLRGSGFAPGAQVRFAGSTYTANYRSVTELEFRVLDYEEIAVGPGRKEVCVVNPDGRTSDALHFDLTFEIQVRIKAWLVFPDIVYGGSTFWGPGPERDEGDVKRLFMKDPRPFEIWINHWVSLQFDPEVGLAHVAADMGDSWPRDEPERTNAEIKAKDEEGNYLHFEPGAINFYFVDDIDDWWCDAFAPIGNEHNREAAEWVIFEDTPLNTDSADARVAAHELGHVFGLPHVCGPPEDNPTFGRQCTDEDARYLMDPGGFNWFIPSGTYLTPLEARMARRVARLWHKL
jgi:hypothetical protein